MRRQLWWNIGLALAVTVLAALTFLKTDEAGDPAQFRLSTLNAASVDFIRITRAHQAPIEFRKRGADWFLDAPLRGRAENTRVAGLLGLLTARSPKRLPAQDLGRFELDRPLLTLTLGAQPFTFGGTQPLSNQVYVLTGGMVYLLSPVYLADAVQTPAAYLSKQVLDDREIPVGFAFNGFSLQREHGTWHLQRASATLTQDAANAFADAWRHALANSVTPLSTPSDAARVDVRLESGKPLSFRYWQDGGEWLFLREDEGLAYRLSQAEAKELLQPAFAPEATRHR